jgi:hypothetical protein
MSHGATLALEQDHRVDIRFGVGHFTRPIPDQAKGSKTTVRRSMPGVYGCTRCYPCPAVFTMFEWLFFAANVLSEDPEAGLGGQQEPIAVSQVLSLGSRRQTSISGQGVSVFTPTWSVKCKTPYLRARLTCGRPMIDNAFLCCWYLSGTNWVSSCTRKKHPRVDASLVCWKVPQGERWVSKSAPQTTVTYWPPFRASTVPIPRSGAMNCMDFETRVTPLVREPSSWLHRGHPYCLTRLRRAINTGAAATHLLSLAGAVWESIAHPAKTQNGVRAHNLRADRPPSVIAFESVLLDPEAPVQ